MTPKILSKSVCEDVMIDGRFAQAKRIDGKLYKTVSKLYWEGIKSRTKVGGPFQKIHLTCVGTSNGFADFQDFASWAISQIGYGSGDLDKDILVHGCKIYSPDTCCFVPKHVNKLLINNKANRGEYPVGVYYNKSDRKFQARLSVCGKTKYLGNFDTPEEAFAAYKAAKEAEIKRVTDLYKDVLDKRVYEALQSWKVLESD